MPIEIQKDIILKGDCLEILKSFPDNSVDLVFADPPYNMQTEGELLRTDGSSFNGVTDKWDFLRGNAIITNTSSGMTNRIIPLSNIWRKTR